MTQFFQTPAFLKRLCMQENGGTFRPLLEPLMRCWADIQILSQTSQTQRLVVKLWGLSRSCLSVMWETQTDGLHLEIYGQNFRCVSPALWNEKDGIVTVHVTHYGETKHEIASFK